MVLDINPDDPLVEAATAGTLLAGGAVHALPNELTPAIDQDIIDLDPIPVVPDVPLTVQRAVGVTSVGLGIVAAMDAADGNMR
jgi:hypothetical protein